LLGYGLIKGSKFGLNKSPFAANDTEELRQMKITRIELHLIRVPFDMGAAPTAFAGMNWTSVDSLFVRVRTDAGIDGWGEGWGHIACPITSAALTALVGPAFIGRDVSDRSRLMTEMFRRFHIHGRTGPVVYALSAIEIAVFSPAAIGSVVAARTHARPPPGRDRKLERTHYPPVAQLRRC